MNRETQPYLFSVEEYEAIQKNSIFVTWVMLLDVSNPLDPKILVSERVEDGGGYTFPGGKVEDDESFVKAALREVREETDIKIYPDSNIYPASHDLVKYLHDGKKLEAKYFFYFIGESNDNDEPKLMEPDKHKGWEWISFHELKSLVGNGDFPSIVWSENNWIYEAIHKIMEMGVDSWGESIEMDKIRRQFRNSTRLIPANSMIECLFIQAESEIERSFGMSV